MNRLLFASRTAHLSKVRLGLAVSLLSAMAACGLGLTHWPILQRLNPAIATMLLGALLAPVIGLDQQMRKAISAVTRLGLRLAIVLLGFQISLGQLASIGPAGIAIVILSVSGCFIATMFMGRLLQVDEKLADLIAVGTSVCGASAILAANAVSQADDEDVAYALSTITLYGTVAMFAYPMAASLFGMDNVSYGLWAGSSIHEIAQVVVAGYQVDPSAGEVATISKLGRVLLLAPLVTVLGLVVQRREAQGTSRRPPLVPWFIAAFLAAVATTSCVPIPPVLTSLARVSTTFLLAIVLGGIGLTLTFRQLRSRGLRPLILAGLSSLFICLLSFGLINAFA